MGKENAKLNRGGKRIFSGREKIIAISVWYRVLSYGAPTDICNI